MLLAAPAAAGEGSVTYVPGAGGDVVRNLAGAAYLVLVGVFIARLLRKRANSSLTQARREVSHTGTACRPTSPTLAFHRISPFSCGTWRVQSISGAGGQLPCSAAAQARQQLAHAGALPLLIATMSFGCWAICLVVVVSFITVLLRNGSNGSHRQARRADHCSQDGVLGAFLSPPVALVAVQDIRSSGSRLT